MNTTKTIIGFSGRMQSGKSTAADYLIRQYGGKMLPFSGSLKQIVARTIFGTLEYNEEQKTQVVAGRTGRGWYQKVGTDWFRNAYPEAWVNAWSVQLQEVSVHNIFVDDVRFPNEVTAIHKLGGVVIRLTRTVNDDPHPSETALDNLPVFFDAIVSNRTISCDKKNRLIQKICVAKGWLPHKN